jgi:hypothetical protein
MVLFSDQPLQAEFLNTIPHLVPVDAEQLAGMCLVSAGALQCLYQKLTLDVFETPPGTPPSTPPSTPSSSPNVATGSGSTVGGAWTGTVSRPGAGAGRAAFTARLAGGAGGGGGGGAATKAIIVGTSGIVSVTYSSGTTRTTLTTRTWAAVEIRMGQAR